MNRILLAGHGVIPLLLLYLIIQSFASEPNYENLSGIPIIGAGIAKWTAANPDLKWLLALILSGLTSLLLIIPNVIDAWKRHKEHCQKAEALKATLHAELSTALVGLATQLKGRPNARIVAMRGAGCKGNIRANVCLVRRKHLQRYLEHFTSSRVGVHPDRDIRFKLDEGIAGHAYGNPGTLLVEDFRAALPMVRQFNARKFSGGTAVVAARAIAYPNTHPECPHFNQVVGVLILTSDKAADKARLESPEGRNIIEQSIGGLFDRLAKLRSAYDGY